MFSGKSNQLQEIGRQYQIAGYTVHCFHHADNTRDTDGVIRTHNGVEFESKPLESLEVFHRQRINRLFDSPCVVLLEEAQFFTDLEVLLTYFEQLNIDVYFAALNMKYNGQPWESIRDIMHTCTHVKYLYSVCVKCGSTRARYSHRTTEQTGDVVIGGQEEYQALCKSCFSDTYNGGSV
jgi:thymidine kinase